MLLKCKCCGDLIDHNSRRNTTFFWMEEIGHVCHPCAFAMYTTELAVSKLLDYDSYSTARSGFCDPDDL